MTDEDLAKLEALAAAATPRETWECGTCGHRIGTTKACTECSVYYHADPFAPVRAFEKAAALAVPALCRELREARAEVARMHKLADDAILFEMRALITGTPEQVMTAALAASQAECAGLKDLIADALHEGESLFYYESGEPILRRMKDAAKGRKR